MPNSISGRAIASQIVRSGTSPAANYRAACIGKSEKDFLNKLKMVEEELDETCHWIEVMHDGEFINDETFNSIMTDAVEIRKLLTTIIKNTRANIENSRSK